jgi:hypothetical protein
MSFSYLNENTVEFLYISVEFCIQFYSELCDNLNKRHRHIIRQTNNLNTFSKAVRQFVLIFASLIIRQTINLNAFGKTVAVCPCFQLYLIIKC